MMSKLPNLSKEVRALLELQAEAQRAELLRQNKLAAAQLLKSIQIQVGNNVASITVGRKTYG